MSKKDRRHRFDFENWEEIEKVIKTKLTDIKKYGKILMFDFLKGVYDAGCDEGEIIGYKSALQENNLDSKSTYNEGLEDGRNRGYDDGFAYGVVIGKESGHESGWKDGYEEGKEHGRFEGYTKGFDDGIEGRKYQ